ncbi:histidine phosphatase family protein [Salinisphaera aquimarina]
MPFGGAWAADDNAALWRGLANGDYVALMRHASAPGYGDPEDFTLGDCATQRNLSAAGRAQARAIGARFRAHGIDAAVVRSSQWCRCLDTARLLDLGAVIATPALNSFFSNRAQGAAQTETVRALLAEAGTRQPTVLVTHQVNITALSDVFPASGEIVVLQPSATALDVVGRIAPP